MGYIRHNAIVVTGDDYPEAQKKFDKAYEKAIELFEGLVSNVITSSVNRYQSFFIAPDGSKEGWSLSSEYNVKREEFANFLDSLAHGDGSNSIQFVDVGFDECHEAEIDRTNKVRP